MSTLWNNLGRKTRGVTAAMVVALTGVTAQAGNSPLNLTETDELVEVLLTTVSNQGTPTINTFSAAGSFGAPFMFVTQGAGDPNPGSYLDPDPVNPTFQLSVEVNDNGTFDVNGNHVLRVRGDLPTAGVGDGSYETLFYSDRLLSVGFVSAPDGGNDLVELVFEQQADPQFNSSLMGGVGRYVGVIIAFDAADFDATKANPFNAYTDNSPLGIDANDYFGWTTDALALKVFVLPENYQVPEPTTGLMFGLMAGGFLRRSRRRRD